MAICIVLVFFGIFYFLGGLKAIAKVNVFQMIFLIVVSLMLPIIGLKKWVVLAAFDKAPV